MNTDTSFVVEHDGGVRFDFGGRMQVMAELLPSLRRLADAIHQEEQYE